MAERSTTVLDQATRKAVRRRRSKALERLFELFDSVDPDAEVRRIKAEDAGFCCAPPRRSAPCSSPATGVISPASPTSSSS